MICFILARSNSNTIKNYLAYRGKPMAGFIRIVYYDNLKELNNLECSTLIFSDFDRLNASQLREVSLIYGQIKAKYPRINLINNPQKVKLRYDLLRSLYLRGINNYNIYRLNEPMADVRFPVFLREENNHTGALSDLIYDEKSLRENILALNLQGYPSKNLLVAEYTNVSNPDGIFKKYSALKVSDRIFPRQLDYDTHWMVKTNVRFNTYPEQEYLEEFTSFMRDNPHQGWLEEIFNHAGIEYGRIDYGFFKGRPIVWEINLNPNYGGSKNRKNNKRNPVVDNLRSGFHTQLRTKMQELEQGGQVMIQIEIPEEVLKIMKPDTFSETWRKLHNLLTSKKPQVKILIRLMRKSFLMLARIIVSLFNPAVIQQTEAAK